MASEQRSVITGRTRALGHSVRDATSRLQRKLAESGWAYTTQIALQRVMPGSLLDVSLLWLCERSLVEEPPVLVNDPGFVLRTPSEMGELVADGVLPAKLAPAATDPTAIIWTLHRGDELAGYFLMRRREYRPFHFLRVDLAEDEVAGSELYVVPDERGTGLGPHMNRLVAQQYHREGLTLIAEPARTGLGLFNARRPYDLAFGRAVASGSGWTHPGRSAPGRRGTRTP